jgi:GcrA cell cycle regulator
MLDDLKSRWAAGESAKQIADALGNGATRNAVISKVHRLGLRGGGSRGVNATMSRAKALKRPKPAKANVSMIRIPKAPVVKAEPLPSEPPADAACVSVRLEDLAPHHCRWPVGDPQVKDFGFCGELRAPERSYCPAHCAVAYQQKAPTPKRKKLGFDFTTQRRGDAA